jgi:superfamily II DNA or RNA helicase
MEYQEFVARKRVADPPTGFDPGAINPQLFEFQRDIVRWACRRGRAAIFADCGLGKTPMQLDWARLVSAHAGGPVLILAPLAVSRQTRREGEKFGVPVTICRSQDDVRDGVNIANYEMLEHFSPEAFGGIVLDESSILKAYGGKTCNAIIDSFRSLPYKLACTATPSPNDHMELGNHAEFVGAMTRGEMLSMFFVHDGGETSKWRIKGHAEDKFWEWVASWAVMLRKPSDLGYNDSDFILPRLSVSHAQVLDNAPTPGMLFRLEARSLDERRDARRGSIAERVAQVASMANASTEQWLVWCNLNDESERLSAAIPDAVEVTGSDSDEHKESSMLDFAAGKIRVLVTKPKIAGFGMNWQNCHNVAFCGLSDSFESYYQAVRRCWRFGQQSPVNVHIVTSAAEQSVVENIARKEADAAKMAEGMVVHMHKINERELHGGIMRDVAVYAEDDKSGDGWELKLGDCVERVKELADGSVGFTVFSPPFSSLYTYSNSERDMGNSRDDGDFHQHFGYLIDEILRVTMPGRLVSVHCMNLPSTIQHNGYIGLRDFRGDIIRDFTGRGFIYHSEVCIWKDPVTAMQRTKAIGLLHKQLVKDSCLSRQGLPDYLCTFRKPGVNAVPAAGPLTDYCGDDETFQSTMGRWNRDEMRESINIWQRYASPVWMDINPSRTLQKESAREEKDERHICPLQLDVIERACQLWSAPGDLVLSPFAGIGSEGFVAVKMGRRFVGVELKRSYFDQAVKNLARAKQEQGTLL